MKERKKLFARLWDLPYGHTTPYNLFDASKNSRDLVQKFQLQRKIPVHNGCVNSICWNETGNYLLSGSDDQHLSVINANDYSVLAYVRTGHRANIFSAKFLPSCGDSHVISSSGDGIIIYSNLERSETSMNNKFGCHRGTAYEIMTVPNDPNTFLSCGEDRTVRWFDIRTKTSCNAEDCKDDILIFCRSPVTTIAINPLIPYQLAVGCADSSVQIFDRRMLATQATAGCLSNGFRALMTYFTVPDFPQSRRITSLCYSKDGREMLVNYSSDYIYLFDVKDDMGRKPKVLSSSESGPYSRTRPVMKRLRVRGDWSDTGPNSRPEAESSENHENSSPHNLVRRMTDILTRMLFSSTHNRTSSTASRSSSESSPLASSHSEDGEVEATLDSNNSAGATHNKVNSEATTSQTSDNNEIKSQTVPVATQTEDILDASTNNCSAFEEGNAKPEPLDSSNMPSTSRLETKCDSPTVIKDSENSNIVQFEPQPSTSHSATLDAATSYSSAPDAATPHSSASDGARESILSEESFYSDAHNVTCTCTKEPPPPPSPTYELETPPEFSPEFEERINRSGEAGSESETEAAVQSIQRRDDIPSVSVFESPRSPSPEPAVENAEDVELMMEVDSWDSDSDDGTSQPRSSQSSRRRRRSQPSLSCDETASDRKNEVIKYKPPKNVARPNVKKMYTGHRNARTMIKESTFWGDDFVMSGSDCGHIFIWDRHTTELVMIMEADHHVVNCLQPHPFDPILASSGIDYDIKIWTPSKEEPFFDVEKANEIVKRNEIMLEVTKDTITVPASFMFNMFNTLNNLRNGPRQLYRWNRAARSSNQGSASNR